MLIVVKVESNTPFNTRDIETNSGILGPNNTNSPLLLILNEVFIVVKGKD